MDSRKARFGLMTLAIALLLTFTGSGVRFAAGQESGTAPSPTATGARVIMLGTGTPMPDPERSGPSVAVVVGNASYIVDCGPGVVRRAAAAAYRHRIPALLANNLKVLFVTHLHTDHTVGYPDIIFTPAVVHRDAPLEVYGPPGLKAMTDHILEAYKEDIDIRINGLEHGNPAGYVVNVHEIQPGVIYKDSNVTVKAFAVKHGAWKYAYGYRFETPGRTIVISGDTSPAQSVVDNCDGCDLLFHEVYCQEGYKSLGPEKKKYFTEYHTSTVELGEIAAKARPRELVLYHQIPWECPENQLITEVNSVFNGKVVSAHDLDIF
ncbi:MAG TPA: MBL fold metallo-hydrolase [Blastocatellia bacterium]|nr:MBL fold metallo-hydrolase [Blastocatellia bacterium]